MNVFDQVKSIIVEVLKVDAEKVTLETNLAEDLGADSLDAVDVVMELEEKYDIEIPDEAAQNLKTVQDLVSYIESQTK